MRILFIGDASAAHFNLAEGLKSLGHEALVISHRGGWRNHPCHVQMIRKPGKLGALAYLAKWLMLLPKLQGYDVVQFVGPHFIELKAERRYFFYRYLRRHNRRIVMTALGDDYYWAMVNDRYLPFRYGDFNIGDKRRTNPDALRVLSEWRNKPDADFNIFMARDCDLIVPILYEYWVCYDRFYHDKTTYMPLPVILPEYVDNEYDCQRKIRLFIGIQKDRDEFKGTDIMLRAAQRLAEDYADRVELTVAESVPYPDYLRMLEKQDILFDQLYSYTPAMNALIAMARGVIVVGGGEPEHYELMGEPDLRPIVNVWPSEESVYAEVERLILQPTMVAEMKRQSLEYIRKHHSHTEIAGRYVEMYRQLLQ